MVLKLNSDLLDADFGYAIDASADVGTTVVGAPTQMLISAKFWQNGSCKYAKRGC